MKIQKEKDTEQEDQERTRRQAEEQTGKKILDCKIKQEGRMHGKDERNKGALKVKSWLPKTIMLATAATAIGERLEVGIVQETRRFPDIGVDAEEGNMYLAPTTTMTGITMTGTTMTGKGYLTIMLTKEDSEEDWGKRSI